MWPKPMRTRLLVVALISDANQHVAHIAEIVVQSNDDRSHPGLSGHCADIFNRQRITSIARSLPPRL